MTKEKVIEILRAIRKNDLECAEITEKPSFADRMNSEALGIWTAIQILENNEFASDMAAIYGIEV